MSEVSSLQREIENEYIDKSHWIPDGEPLLIKEQYSRIQVTESVDRGGIEYRALATRSLFSYLYERDHITAQQFRSGCDYHAWKDYFAAQLSGRGIPLPIDPVGLGESMTYHLYSLLLRKIHRVDQQQIDFVLETPATEHMVWLLERSLKHYRIAFVHLEQLMENLSYARKQAEDRFSSHADICNAITRVFFSLTR